MCRLTVARGLEGSASGGQLLLLLAGNTGVTATHSPAGCPEHMWWLGRVPRMRADVSKAFLSLGLEVAQCYFPHVLLVKIHRSGNDAHLLTEGVTKSHCKGPGCREGWGRMVLSATYPNVHNPYVNHIKTHVKYSKEAWNEWNRQNMCFDALIGKLNLIKLPILCNY